MILWVNLGKMHQIGVMIVIQIQERNALIVDILITANLWITLI